MDGAKYLKINFNATGGKADTTYEAMTTIQLEKGSVATPYEPHKSSILSLREEVVLRSLPNGVCDTFNTGTGVYTQRIWSATFNGTESYTKWESSAVAEGMTGIYTRIKVNDKIVTSENQDGQILCDTLPTIHRNQLSSCQYDSVVKGNNYIGFTMKGKTSEEMKQWLSENPTTVYCELKTPIVTTIDLSIVDQDGNTIPKIKSYDGVTHFEVTVPKQSLLPNVSAEVATDNSKDMSSLITKHQEISEAQLTIQNSIQSQTDEIDTAMMATTEIFESILE